MLLKAQIDPTLFTRILWSDETSVTAFPKNRKMTVWVHSTVRESDRPINPTVQGGGFSVMFWGCFSRGVVGKLTVCDGSINATEYKKLLEDVVIPEINASEKDLIYMQDNAPCHKAKVVMEYLDEMNVETMNWPPQSPDLNPIENLWAIIKEKLYREKLFPRNKAELIDRVFTIWDELEPELMERLADSFIKRLKLVVKSKGKWIKY